MIAAHVLVALLSSGAASPTVFLDGPESLTNDVRVRVNREIDVAWAPTSTASDLRFEINRSAANLVVHHEERGRSIERRTIDMRDREAGLRVVALLVVNAIERWTPAVADEPPGPLPTPPIPTATISTSSVAPPVPPPEVMPRFRVGAAVEVLGWNAPIAPQLGISGTGAVRFGPVWVGARVAVLRLCCTLTGDGIEASALTISGQIEAQLTVWSGPVDLGVVAGVGVAGDRVSAVPIFPGGRGPPDQTTLVGASGRAAVWGQGALGPLTLTLAAGVWLQPSALVVRLPAPYDTTSTTLSRGAITPHVAFEVALPL